MQPKLQMKLKYTSKYLFSYVKHGKDNIDAYKVTIERRNETKIEFSHIAELGWFEGQVLQRNLRKALLKSSRNFVMENLIDQ